MQTSSDTFPELSTMSQEEFDVFVCYYENGAADFAAAVHRALVKDRGYRVFVAHLYRNQITGDFHAYVDSVIRNCKVFILLNTYSALDRDEIKRELSIALPNGFMDKHAFWIFKEKSDDVHRGSGQITKETKIDLASQMQSDFTNENELIRHALRRCDSKRKFKEPSTALRISSVAPIKLRIKQKRVKFSPDFSINKIMDQIEEETKKGNLPKVSELYDRILDQNPNNLEALNNKGIVLALQQKYDEADLYFSSAIYLNNRVPDVWLNKSLMFMKRSDFQKSLIIINKALNIIPNEPELLTLKALILFAMRDFDGSIKLYKKIMDMRPESGRAIGDLAAVLPHVDRGDEARALLEKAISLDDQNDNAHYNLGVLLRSKGEYIDALHSLERAIELNPKEPLYYNEQAIVYRILGKLSEALAAYDMAIRLNPVDPLPLNNKGIALGFLERYTEALGYFTKALQLNDKFADAYVNRATAYSKIQKNDLALADLEQAFMMTRKPEILAAIGQVQYDIGHKSKAIESFRQSIGLNPKDQLALASLASILLSEGQPQEAIALYTKAIELEPDNPSFLLGRSVAYTKTKRYKDAINDCEKVIDVDPSISLAFYNKACALAPSSITEALIFLEKAFRLDPALKVDAIHDPDLDNLKQEQRFNELIHRGTAS